MKIRLPRPRHQAATLPPLTGAALAVLASSSRPHGGILPTRPDHLTAVLSTTPCHVSKLLSDLSETRHIILSTDLSHLAVVSVVSAKLHSEKTAARKARTRGNRVKTAFLDSFLTLFPSVVSAKHKSSYLCPSAFSPILAKFESHHFRRRPADVEVLTEAFYPGELGSLLTCIAEQESARRVPILLYTRKAVYLAIRRHGNPAPKQLP